MDSNFRHNFNGWQCSAGTLYTVCKPSSTRLALIMDAEVLYHENLEEKIAQPQIVYMLEKMTQYSVLYVLCIKYHALFLTKQNKQTDKIGQKAWYGKQDQYKMYGKWHWLGITLKHSSCFANNDVQIIGIFLHFDFLFTLESSIDFFCVTSILIIFSNSCHLWKQLLSC